MFHVLFNIYYYINVKSRFDINRDLCDLLVTLIPHTTYTSFHLHKIFFFLNASLFHDSYKGTVNRIEKLIMKNSKILLRIYLVKSTVGSIIVAVVTMTDLNNIYLFHLLPLIHQKNMRK